MQKNWIQNLLTEYCCTLEQLGAYQWCCRDPMRSPAARCRACIHPCPEGRLRLDPEDAQEALLLSDELQLNEIAALAWLQAAHNEVRLWHGLLDS